MDWTEHCSIVMLFIRKFVLMFSKATENPWNQIPRAYKRYFTILEIFTFILFIYFQSIES